MTPVERAVFAKLLEQCKSFGTTRRDGEPHLAIKNNREHLGYCSWRSESNVCQAWRKVIADAEAILNPSADLEAVAG